MKKRSILTSVVASSMLVSVLMISGCGGSSAGGVKTLPGLDSSDKNAGGSAKIIADSNGDLNTKIPLISTKQKEQVAEVTIKKVTKDDGTAACTQSTDNCKVTVKQITACGIDASDEAFTKAKAHVLDLQNVAGDRYDANKDMVVFGGIMTISCSGFDNATVALSINMISCGAAFTKDGTPVNAGFSNEGHIVDVYVEDADGNDKWINNIKIKDGKILIPSDKLDCIKLPATFTFYSIKDSTKDNTTGITGSTGAGGY
jgi:hypothetical protein